MRAILKDASSGKWRLFERPRELVVVRALEEVMPALRKVERECANGAYAAGFIAYEAAAAFDPALRTKEDGLFPLLWFGLYDRFQDLPHEAVDEVVPADATVAEEWTSSIDSSRYADLFGRVQELIRGGDTYQVNLTYRLKAAMPTSPWAFFLQLIHGQEPDFGAYLHAGAWIVCSASPELFFEKDGCVVRSKPMKGTAARGLWYEDDVDRASRLSESDKERAENVMIVDMVRNDLGRIARPGSVAVPRLCEVERYPTLWQMTSTVTADTDASLTDVIAALFPPASITGAPKVRTMEIIADLESFPRRIYTGTVGFIEPGGRAQFNVAIRTALINRKANDVEYGVGGGIVADSNVDQEWAETRLKSRVLGAPKPSFDLLETMLWKPHEGYVLLGQHLRRLGHSAEYFKHQVDLGTVESRLTALASTFDERPYRVRMTVSRNGSIDLKASPMVEDLNGLTNIPLAAAPVDPDDPFLYHKTTNRVGYQAALASRPGARDVLLFNAKNEVTESTIANVIAEFGGQLFTPPIECGLLPGTARAQLLEAGSIRERKIAVADLKAADRLFLVNSVRGMYPVSITDPYVVSHRCTRPSDAA